MAQGVGTRGLSTRGWRACCKEFDVNSGPWRHEAGASEGEGDERGVREGDEQGGWSQYRIRERPWVSYESGRAELRGAKAKEDEGDDEGGYEKEEEIEARARKVDMGEQSRVQIRRVVEL
ncbi:hypothetical protein EDB85DRAFT_1900023 [Lactarius pseudohatsudake]|nr:hypothetical protein EDB85DRAFT_1900023 [Lactarius pseudohatsudake]